MGVTIIGKPYFWHTGKGSERRWRCNWRGVTFDVAGPDVPRETLEVLAAQAEKARLRRYATLARRRSP